MHRTGSGCGAKVGLLEKHIFKAKKRRSNFGELPTCALSVRVLVCARVSAYRRIRIGAYFRFEKVCTATSAS